MGQSGIPMLNKVGHSMFWDSMWNQKIHYNRSFKEDLFLNKFFFSVFSDSLSVNFLKIKKKNLNHYKNYYYSINFEKKSLLKFLRKKNNSNLLSSKLWILKYQKWIVIYYFFYNLKNKKIDFNTFDKSFFYKDNFFYSIKCYEKSINKFNNKYFFLKKQNSLCNYF